MAGPNFVLDKGFYVKSDQTGIKFGLAASIDATSTGDRVVKAVATLAVGASPATRVVGVFQEDIDDAKVATGKAAVNVRMLGITRMIAGGALAIGDSVKSDAAGKAVKGTGVVGGGVHGIALTVASGPDVWVDVFLTPGATSVA